MGEAMKGGSLFSGLGGLDLALEACGVEVKWQVEYNEYCNKVLERHWPDVKRYTDIRTTDFRELEHVDLICGGFPCQPFSVAGKNRGEADERNMWPDTFRAIRESGCRYAFLENVPNLLTHSYFGTIIADLASIGFNAEWDCFTASEVGATHRRRRLFILAYSNDISAQQQERNNLGRGASSESWQGIRAGAGRRTSDGNYAEGMSQPLGNPFEMETAVANAGCQHQHLQQRIHGAEYQGSRVKWPPSPDDKERWASLLSEVPSLEPALCRVADGIPDRTHRLKALGNAVVPATGELAFRTLWGRISINDDRA